MKLKTLLISLLLSVPGMSYAKAPEVVKKALSSSAMVSVNNTIGGSAVAVRHLGKGTIFASNDHVCQWSRGSNFLRQNPNYNNPLNTWKVTLMLVDGKKVQGTVVFVSNSTNPEVKNSSTTDDLCLIYVDKSIPIVSLNEEDLEIGEEVFSVSAPHGLFPQVTYGGIGGYYKDEQDYFGSASLMITEGSSGGGVFNKETGKLVGVLFAIAPITEKVPAPVAAFYVPVTQLSDFLKLYDARRQK